VISPASQRSVPIAWNTLLILVAAKIGIHALLSGPLAWGYMTDALYLLDSLDRLDWGFVDHPPLSVALLLLVRTFLGDSIVAIRILPALFSAAIVLITGLLAREARARGIAWIGSCGQVRRRNRDAKVRAEATWSGR
jgi:hypothetical protein